MRVLRIGIVKFAEDRLPLIRIVVREMGIPFHFGVNVRQIKLPGLRQELLIDTTAADHHYLFNVAAGGDRFINRLHPLHAIVGARLAADNDILTPGSGRPMETPRSDAPSPPACLRYCV